ncbi:MAG: replication protein RepA [Candidatus Thiodiazotropha sp.]
MAAHAYITRLNIGGNYCGHDPAKPNLALVQPAKKGKGGLPRVLTLCAERVTGYFYRPRKVLPSLDLANGSDRQQRSERREACIKLLAALLKYTDLVSLRVGVPTPTGFMSYTVDYIAKDTGMTLKRVERAMADLKAASLITVSQPRQLLSSGNWRGLAAVKAISRDLFGAFGLATMLKRERDKASKRLRKKAQQWDHEANNEPPTRTGKARFSLFIRTLATDLNHKTHHQKNQPSAFKASDPPEYQKQLMLKAAEIKQAHMDWDKDKCYEEAKKQLLGPSTARA